MKPEVKNREITNLKTSTYNCWLHGFSLRPMILNSMLRCLVLILKFLSIFLAYTSKENWNVIEKSMLNLSDEVGEFLTLAQSISRGSRTFWLAIKKSITGPGLRIIVVDTSAINESSDINKQVNKTALQKFTRTEVKLVPMLRDKPPWVGRKLEWYPLIPVTPSPTSTKFLESSWKNDCLTKRHPLFIQQTWSK